MRSVGRLSDERQATTFVDYLFTQGIRAKAERHEVPDSATTWEIWVFDEDRRAAAKETLDAFRATPEAERFLTAEKEAERLRRAEVDREFELRRKQAEINRSAFPRRSSRRPITMTLMVLSCLVFIWTDGADSQHKAAEMRKVFISAHDFGTHRFAELIEVRTGEWYRLVSPIFLHMSWVHLIFNMLFMLDFGAQVETQRGSRKMLLLTLLFAVVPNLAQFRMVGPAFGGMSGVGFGLFGYVWMKSVYEPESGFNVQPMSAYMMLAWFMLGVTYDFVPIIRMANWAHGVGLVLGLICGYAPTFVRSLRSPR